eukprot:gnl/TRDRNA2_/TRDRNA2_167932_c0_seq3.p1 gnl/TRDRNA2_/TRDRNA2_167932_c0~~gnl/TRDRNA2_/TRDRNA2_167932_c0_seq3.p1  ORF type:complete len:643 (+),score=73.89 gnl/TRDRNA2_/TRDRNA2_167932_c0_seq3:246-1931(+)
MATEASLPRSLLHTDSNLNLPVGPVSRCAINPSSKQRLSWDLCGVVVLGYDLVMIPIDSAFAPPSNPFSTAMSMITMLYWSCDVLGSLLTGYFQRDGKLVMQLSRIVKHYLRTWFLADILIVGIDWAMLVVDSGAGRQGSNKGAGIMRAGKSLRILRILRTLRLLRLAKLRAVMQTIQDCIDSEYLSVVRNLIQLLLVIISINHLLACAWYGVGTHPPVGESSWTESFFMPADNWNFFDRYCTCLHWALTQFTPGSMPVQPQNSFERLFAIITLLFALVVFSSFVSSITATMTRLRMLNSGASTKLFTLRKYFRQAGISRDLSVRIYRYVNVELDERGNRVQQKDVELLSVLSKPLLHELHCDIVQPKLMVHPLFRRLSIESHNMMRTICCEASQETCLVRGDILFCSGEHGREMYFLTRGLLHYTPVDSTSGRALTPQELVAGQFCSEAVLWTTQWWSRGIMGAKLDCDLLVLHAVRLREAMMHHPAQLDLTRSYAAAFIQSLNVSEAEGACSDIQLSLLGMRPIAEVLHELERQGHSSEDGILQVFWHRAKTVSSFFEK